MEQLENYRHKLDNFKGLIGTVQNYNFFENYYTEMMNKLEHKNNILENGGIETALSKKTHFSFIKFFKKIFNINYEKEENL